MSRIGKRVIEIPDNVNVKVENNKVIVKGPKGSLELQLIKNITVELNEKTLIVKRLKEDKFSKAMHGTTNSNIYNMILGVSKGYKKELEIIGVGYRFIPKDKILTINAGYSHQVNIKVPDGITVKGISNTEIEIEGIDKVALGEFAANVRKVRPPEPYKGKGIRYKDEQVRRKEGKKAAK